MTVDEQIQLIAVELRAAADQIITSASLGLDVTTEFAADERAARLRDVLNDILATCAFQDIAGQRLAELAKLVAGLPARDPLLSGPAQPGSGLDQDGADAAFAMAGQGDV